MKRTSYLRMRNIYWDVRFLFRGKDWIGNEWEWNEQNVIHDLRKVMKLLGWIWKIVFEFWVGVLSISTRFTVTSSFRSGYQPVKNIRKSSNRIEIQWRCRGKKISATKQADSFIDLFIFLMFYNLACKYKFFFTFHLSFSVSVFLLILHIPFTELNWNWNWKRNWRIKRKF